MDCRLLFQDAGREQTDRVIVCRVRNLHHVGLTVGAVENVVHDRRPFVGKIEDLFILLGNLDCQPVFVFCGRLPQARFPIARQ